MNFLLDQNFSQCEREKKNGNLDWVKAQDVLDMSGIFNLSSYFSYTAGLTTASIYTDSGVFRMVPTVWSIYLYSFSVCCSTPSFKLRKPICAQLVQKLSHLFLSSSVD